MTKFEFQQVYRRCFVCCTPHHPGARGRKKACTTCWTHRGVYTPNGREKVMSEPIPFLEWVV